MVAVEAPRSLMMEPERTYGLPATARCAARAFRRVACGECCWRIGVRVLLEDRGAERERVGDGGGGESRCGGGKMS
eukprot:2942508-Rhodomonas_salina.1